MTERDEQKKTLTVPRSARKKKKLNWPALPRLCPAVTATTTAATPPQPLAATTAIPACKSAPRPSAGARIRGPLQHRHHRSRNFRRSCQREGVGSSAHRRIKTVSPLLPIAPQGLPLQRQEPPKRVSAVNDAPPPRRRRPAAARTTAGLARREAGRTKVC